jgi:hypothetical protein
MAEESGVGAFQKQDQILPSQCSGCSAITPFRMTIKTRSFAMLRTTTGPVILRVVPPPEGSGVGFLRKSKNEILRIRSE